MASDSISSSPHQCIDLLPTEVFAEIAQCLSLPHKFTQLTRVSRSFPSLSPVCFLLDCLVWTAPLLRPAHEISMGARKSQLLKEALDDGNDSNCASGDDSANGS
jgi:hypothetical protein